MCNDKSAASALQNIGSFSLVPFFHKKKNCCRLVFSRGTARKRIINAKVMASEKKSAY